MPQPNSTMDDFARMGVSGFEGEESHSAKRGVIFQMTLIHIHIYIYSLLANIDSGEVVGW